MSFDLSNVWGASDQVPFGRKKPGAYLVEVGKAEIRVSPNSGNPAVALTLVDTEDGKTLCFDRLNLVGKPTALAMTKSKLKALGYTASNLEPSALIGLRVRVWVKLGKVNDEGKRYLEVDAFDCPEEFRFGYAPVAKKAPAADPWDRPLSGGSTDPFDSVRF